MAQSDIDGAGWDLAQALAHLTDQSSRDGIVHVATTFARGCLPFAAVFGVRTVDGVSSCQGWNRQGPVVGALFASPLVVADDCVVKRSLAVPALFFGRPTLSEGNVRFFDWLGRRRPKTMLLVPIVVGGRPVAALFADAGVRACDPAALADLIIFSSRLGGAFHALLRQHRRTAAPPPALDAESLVVDAALLPSSAPDQVVHEVSSSGVTRTDQELVALLHDMDESVVAGAGAELVARGAAAVPALAALFPGRLRVDPCADDVDVPTAHALSAVVDVLARLGTHGLPVAQAQLESADRSCRFAALLLFRLTPDARCIDALGARLYDDEASIRRLAVLALVPLLAHPGFESVLRELRHQASTSSAPANRRRAVELLGAFRDVGAIPLLVAALATELADAAAAALRVIGLQNHGPRAGAWEKWWAKAKKRSRIDWLVDALDSDDAALRTQAQGELQALAGADVGDGADDVRGDRKRTMAVWRKWWARHKLPMV